MDTIKKLSILYRGNDAISRFKISSNRSGAPPDSCKNRLKHKEILKEKGKKLWKRKIYINGF